MHLSTFTRSSVPVKTRFFGLFILLISGFFATAQTTPPSALSATLTATPNLLTATSGVTSLSATVRGGTAPYSYTFNGPGAITANGSSSATVTGLIPGVHVFTLTARDTGTPASGTIAAIASQSITATASVTVPGGSLASTSTICAGQSATLNVGVTNGTGPFTLVYTSASVGSTAVVSTTVLSYTSGNGIVVSPNATTTYTLISLASVNGLALPIGGAAVVTVNPIPDITVLGSPVLCGTAPSTITATGGSTYLLSNGASSQVNPAGVFTLFQPGSYSLTATSAGCSRTLTFSVATGTAIPNASLVASSSVLTCSTASVSLVASTGGTNYQFTGPGLTQSGINNLAVVTREGIYSVRISGADGCTALVTTSVFSNTVAPPGTFVALNQLSCTNNVVSLSATGAAPGTNYVFGGNGLLLASRTGSVTVTEEGSYSVIFTGSNGCRATLTTTVLSNTAGPASTLFASNNLTCSLPTATLTGPAGNQEYYFSGPGLFRVSGTHSMTVNAPGVYSVLAIGENGCIGKVASTTVAFTAGTSFASLAVSNQLSCSATSTTLVGVGTGSVYTFNGPGVAQFGAASSITVNQPGTYYLTVTGLPGCSATAVTTVVSLTSPPFISVTQTGTLGCAGGSVLLSNINQGFGFEFTGPGGYSTTNTSGTAVVTQAGTYTLVSRNTSTACFGTAFIPVVANCDTKTVVVPPTPIPTSFRMLAPAYNCQTGVITLQTAGGDGSAITFFTPGITRSSPQSATGVVEAGLRFDPKPLVLYATQNGTTVSITFDLIAFCVRGRIANAEGASSLEVTVLGNPTTAELVSVEVRGAEGQPLNYQIRDLTGRLLTESKTNSAADVDRQTLRLGSSSGMYLLNISSPTQFKTVKVIRQ